MPGLLRLIMKILTLFVKNADSSQAEKPKKEMETTTFDDRVFIYFKNDDQRLIMEGISLQNENLELFNILKDCGRFCQDNFNKKVTVTMIYRTQEQQDELYKNDAKYQTKKFTSPHQYWHAFDLRSSTFDTQEREKLVNYLN